MLADMEADKVVDMEVNMMADRSRQFHNFYQISQFLPDFTVLTRFQNFYQISQFLADFTIFTRFHNFDKKIHNSDKIL